LTSRTYRALLVANSTFPVDAVNLPELEGPRNDPVVLRDALCDGAVGLFPADNVRLVTERTMAEVLGEVEDFLSSASSQDTVLLYYSGHGKLDLGGELFLCTRDSRTERLRSTAVKASDLRAMMDESAAAATVVVLDCCHSGRFKGGEVAVALSGRGRFVVTSSRSGELANDADVRNHASQFTHHLAAGLLHGASDNDGDGVVTLSELYDYVHAALAGTGRPVPQKRFEGDGDVAIALREPHADRSRAASGLVDPMVAPPVLDLSDTMIDLGEIGADEDLPPEHIAVINRGGGTLDWTVESSADWIIAVAGEGAVVLHLRPTLGPNRANVYVRDASTGALKTVRITVRVRAPVAAPVVPPATAGPETEAPGPPTMTIESATATLPPTPPRTEAPTAEVPAAPTGETPTPVPATEEPTTPRSATPVHRSSPSAATGTASIPLSITEGQLALGVAAAFVVAGVALANAAADLDLRWGLDLSLRRGWGTGIWPSFVGGVVLAVVGVLAFVPKLNVRLVGCGLGLAVPLSLAGVSQQVGFVEDPFAWSCALGLAAAGLAAILLARLGAWRRTRWAPRPLVGWTTAFALAWAASLLIDFYDQDALDGSTYGGVFSADYPHDNLTAPARVLSMVAAASVVALVQFGFRRLDPAPGAGLVVGAAVTPLLAVGSEISYLVVAGEDPDGARRLLLMIVPALALIACSVAAVVLSRRPLEEPRAGAGRAIGAPFHWARRRPRAASLSTAGISVLLVGGFVVLPSGHAGEQLLTLPITDQELSPGAFSPDATRLAMINIGSAEIRDAETGGYLTTLAGDDEDFWNAATFSPDGDLVATANSSGVKLWDPASGREVADVNGGDTASVVFSPDGTLLAAGGDNGVTLWETDTHEEQGTISDLTAGATTVVFSPDGKRLAIESGDGTIGVWDAATRDQVRQLVGNDVSTAAFTISPDWKYLALADIYGSISLWDPDTADHVRSLPSLGQAAEALAFSPDGSLLAAASGKRVELFDPATGEHLTSLTGHDDLVDAVVFSPDGTRLASASYDSVRIWDPDTR
jgi:WD40 repeat protein